MKMFALHTMSVDLVNDKFILGRIQMFRTFEEAAEERDLIINELSKDYGFERNSHNVEIKDDGYKTIVIPELDTMYEIAIETVYF